MVWLPLRTGVPTHYRHSLGRNYVVAGFLGVDSGCILCSMVQPAREGKMSTPDDAIHVIHALASSEIAFEKALNTPARGIKGATKAMESNRLKAFKMIVGREPNDDEKQKLLLGDS